MDNLEPGTTVPPDSPGPPKNWKLPAALFLLSQTFSILGSSLVQYAIMWHITLTTQSGTLMTIYIVAGFVPGFFLAPFGGVWADRFNRKTLMILADGAIAGVTLIMALIFLSGYEEIWLLFVVAAFRTAGGAVHSPAVGAALPQLVPAEHLMRVNGINSAVQSGLMLGSPILAAALLSVMPLAQIFFIDVVTAAVAMIILGFFLKIPDHSRVGKTEGLSYLSDMVAGFRYIRDHRYLVGFFAYLSALLFLIAPGAFLTPLQVARSFGPDVWRLTAIEIVFSIGMLLSGLLMSTWGGFKNRIHSMVLSTWIMALATIGLGWVSNFWVYLGFMGIFGVALPFFNTPATVIIQEHVESEYLGRVFSVFMMISTSMMPLGMIAFGPLADTVSIESILLVTGGVVALLGFVVLRSKRLVAAGVARESVPVPSTID